MNILSVYNLNGKERKRRNVWQKLCEPGMAVERNSKEKVSMDEIFAQLSGKRVVEKFQCYSV